MNKTFKDIRAELSDVKWDEVPEAPTKIVDDYFADLVTEKFGEGEQEGSASGRLSLGLVNLLDDLEDENGGVKFEVAVDNFAQVAKYIANDDTPVTAKEMLLFLVGFKLNVIINVFKDSREQKESMIGLLKEITEHFRSICDEPQKDTPVS